MFAPHAMYMHQPPSRPTSRASTTQPLPKRTDSIQKSQLAQGSQGSNSQIFLATEDDLRDARRVLTHGQEEDLKYGLERMIKRVEELTSLLKASLAAQSELDTALTLAKSNLQVALLNNEMLEDALKQNGSGKDVGWRRLSAPQRMASEQAAQQRTKTEASPDGTKSANASPQITSATPGGSPPLPSAGPSGSPVVTNASPTTATEGRFSGFKLPFSGPPSRSNSITRSHLTSASLPSLAPEVDHSEMLRRAQEEKDAALKVARQEVDEAKRRLDKEHEELQKAMRDKKALEEELESLSQALFEEANKMVATERIKRSEAEEELREAKREREALRSVIRLMEEENRSARDPNSHASHSRSSSEIALKSPPVRSASPASIALPSSNRSSISSTRSYGEEGAPSSVALPSALDSADKPPTHPDADLVLNPFMRVQAATPLVSTSAVTTPDAAAVARPPLLSRMSSTIIQSASALAASRPASPSLPSLNLSSIFPDATGDDGTSPWADARSMSPRPLGAAFGKRAVTPREVGRERSASRSTAGSRKSFEEKGNRDVERLKAEAVGERPGPTRSMSAYEVGALIR
ncbi:hypothetical protein PUNSTDRAFT_50239 [Punctularia strigosozonata HHB-11173 SS5]|uniref:uncharacterized protein n=1 Tax=Punctularia strigosozonata (strain HHB-11173) TaxID=741275 RepID=UPI0004416560|nr:uncharacterized protein PUNSTDRAFT_50239 [Punctularia strigosozonata HHB-11173 SS5]EIN11135.1 hypothetical protein PUNSTDRAFT_50239 [Punctularia strigosozonata HHB-11173 SS5]